MSCPFCDEKVINTQTIFDSKYSRVIYSIRPANRGQCVVVPKRHVETIRDLREEELADLILSVQKTSKKLDEYLKPIGINYGFNEGEYAGQTVEHFHFHILPRKIGDKDLLPEHHLFHRDPKTKKNLSLEEMRPFVEEFRVLLNN